MLVVVGVVLGLEVSVSAGVELERRSVRLSPLFNYSDVRADYAGGPSGSLRDPAKKQRGWELGLGLAASSVGKGGLPPLCVPAAVQGYAAGAGGLPLPFPIWGNLSASWVRDITSDRFVKAP